MNLDAVLANATEEKSSGSCDARITPMPNFRSRCSEASARQNARPQFSNFLFYFFKKSGIGADAIRAAGSRRRSR
jgi:hypothetical protein